MSKILEMRQKRAEVWDKARAFLDEHTNESGVMSAEDSQQYERMEQEVVDLGHTIDRMERAEQMDRQMNERVSPNLASRPMRTQETLRGIASAEYRNAFWKHMRDIDRRKGEEIPQKQQISVTDAMDVMIRWFCLLFGNQFGPDDVLDGYPVDRLMHDIALALMAVQTQTTEILSQFPTKAAKEPARPSKTAEEIPLF